MAGVRTEAPDGASPSSATGIPDWLRLVPVDFEAGGSGCPPPASRGGKAAVVVSAGVTMDVTKEATTATLRHVAGLVPGSTFAMTRL